MSRYIRTWRRFHDTVRGLVKRKYESAFETIRATVRLSILPHDLSSVRGFTDIIKAFGMYCTEFPVQVEKDEKGRIAFAYFIVETVQQGIDEMRKKPYLDVDERELRVSIIGQGACNADDAARAQKMIRRENQLRYT